MLPVPSGYHSLKNISINTGISKTKSPPQRQKVPPLSTGVIMPLKLPSQYTGKFVRGLYELKINKTKLLVMSYM